MAVGVTLDVADGAPAEELRSEEATTGAREQGELTQSDPWSHLLDSFLRQHEPHALLGRDPGPDARVDRGAREEELARTLLIAGEMAVHELPVVGGHGSRISIVGPPSSW